MNEKRKWRICWREHAWNIYFEITGYIYTKQEAQNQKSFLSKVNPSFYYWIEQEPLERMDK